jgi:hypothetical protein
MLYKEVIAVFVRIVGTQRRPLGGTYSKLCRTGVQLSYVTIWTILSKERLCQRMACYINS